MGIDGAGKTTLAHDLVEVLLARGMDAVFCHSKSLPPDPEVASRLRLLSDLLWDYGHADVLRATGDTHLWFLFLSWLSLFERSVIDPNRALGRVVVTDVWWHKYAARFSMKKMFPQRLVREAHIAVRSPDLLLLLHLDPASALARKCAIKPTESGKLDGFAAGGSRSFVEYQSGAQSQMLRLARDAVQIDAQCSPAEVRDAALAIILERFGVAAGLPFTR